MNAFSSVSHSRPVFTTMSKHSLFQTTKRKHAHMLMGLCAFERCRVPFTGNPSPFDVVVFPTEVLHFLTMHGSCDRPEASWNKVGRPFLRSFRPKQMTKNLLQHSKLLSCYCLLSFNKLCREDFGVDPANSVMRRRNMKTQNIRSTSAFGMRVTLQTHRVTSRFAKFGLGSGMYLEHAQGGLAYDSECFLILTLATSKPTGRGYCIEHSRMREVAPLRTAVR